MKAGDGPAVAELEAQQALAQNRYNNLDRRRTTIQSEIDELDKNNNNNNDTELGELANQGADLTATYPADIEQAKLDAADIDGILVRIEALKWLTHHPTTSTGAVPNGSSSLTIAIRWWRLWHGRRGRVRRTRRRQIWVAATVAGLGCGHRHRWMSSAVEASRERNDVGASGRDLRQLNCGNRRHDVGMAVPSGSDGDSQ